MKNKKDLFDLLKQLGEKDRKIQELFGETYLDREISTLWYLIEEQFSIGENDLTGDWFMDFDCGNLTKKDLVKKLKKLANKFKNN